MVILLLLHLLEELVERLESLLPELAVALGPFGDLLEGGGIEAAEVLPADDAAADESGSLEDADVLGRRGEGHAEGRGDLAEVALAGGEAPDDRPPGGVSQGVEDAVEGGGAI
jgi:hypothetical protein